MCRETLLVWLKNVGTEFNLWFSINILPSDKVTNPVRVVNLSHLPLVHSASPFSSLLTVNGQMEAETLNTGDQLLRRESVGVSFTAGSEPHDNNIKFVRAAMQFPAS